MNASPQISRRRNRLLRTSTVLLAGLFLSTLACRRLAHPETVKIPLSTCSGLPCVDATFGGTKLKLVISLADQNSHLSLDAASRADAHRSAKEIGKVREFKLGSVELSDIFVVHTNLNEVLGKAPEMPSSPIDGTLSYNAFNERLLVLNIPGRVIEVSTDHLKSPACPDACSQLQDSRAANTSDIRTLTADGFAIGNMPLRAQLDTLFEGSVATLKPINGLRPDLTRPSVGLFRGGKLLKAGTAPVYFEGKPVASGAPVFWATYLAASGVQYDSAVGLSILSKAAYAFDLRSMKMWRYE